MSPLTLYILERCFGIEIRKEGHLRVRVRDHRGLEWGRDGIVHFLLVRQHRQKAFERIGHNSSLRPSAVVAIIMPYRGGSWPSRSLRREEEAEDVEIPRASGASAPPTDVSYTVWRILGAFLFGLLFTVLFFRSILPRLPRILFRGKLRIKRAGIRGIRGIEYRSKGFHNDSAAFSRRENQLEIKVQRVYASFHLPYFLRKTHDNPSVVPSKSGAIVTVHVQGVGVRVPRSSPQQSSDANASSEAKGADREQRSSEPLTLEQLEELRLQQLMSSPPMSPSLGGERTFSSSFQSVNDRSSKQESAVAPPTSIHAHDSASFYLTCHRAGLMSIHSCLGLANWFRCAVVPTLQGVVLRAFRAALFILTSSLPVLTSLISIEMDCIEIYVQEAEAVARIGRAGLTFSMSPDFLPSHATTSSTHHDVDHVQQASSYFRTLNWSSFFRTMRMMPTRVGSGARDVATYLVAGMSPSTVAAHLRIESVDFFEANFMPQEKPAHPSRPQDCPEKAEAFSPPQERADSSLMSPSQSDAELDALATSNDDSLDWSTRPTQPRRARSSSASRLSRVPSRSLRGLADRWADWALEPLVESDFHADSGWIRQHIDQGFSPQQLQTIPAAARIASVSGLTELTASLLVGSSLALGGERTLAARFVLGNIALGLDAAHRVMQVIEERKARRSGLAPTRSGLSNDQRSVLSKHLVQQRPSVASNALRMVSSLALSLPSLRVTASSDALLASLSDCKDGTGVAPPPSRELGVSIAGFNLELTESDPRDALHRRWLGTCGLPTKSSTGKGARHKAKSDATSSPLRKHRKDLPHGAKSIEHRRTFLTELNLASIDIRCVSRGHGRGSRLLSVGDISIVARSSWTPFGLFAASPEVSRLLLEGDPNEHAIAIEAAVGGVETDVSVEDVTAIIPIADEFSRRRRLRRIQIGIEEPARPRTDLERLRRVPRIAAGVHLSRISLLLDASRKLAEARAQESCSRKLTLTVPNVDFVFFGEYRDEYVKRPAAEKRAAYKALRRDDLEWPISGLKDAKASQTFGARESDTSRNSGDPSPGTSNVLFNGSASTTSANPAERYAETGLPMQEALQRMQEMQRHPQVGGGRPSATERRPSIRDTMAKTGKVRIPGYSQRSSLAAETRFSLRYQFETSVRIDAIESFLTLGAGSEDASRSFHRPQMSQGTPTAECSQHHLLALHSFEVLGSGRIPGNVEPRGSSLCNDIPKLSAPDTVAEFRANIEDVDIEAWQLTALDTYADIAASILEVKKSRGEPPAEHPAQNEPTDPPTENGQAASAQASPEQTAKSLVERLPGGLALYMSIGRTIAHLGGPDRRLKDRVARGVGFEADRIVVEYAGVTETKTNAAPQMVNWGSRTALELSEDLQLQALSLATRHGRVCLTRVVLHQAGIFPILDAELATQQHTQGTAPESFAQAKAPQGEAWPKEEVNEKETSERPATSLLADSVWSFEKDGGRLHKSRQHRARLQQQDRSNFVCFMPYAAFKAVVRPPQAKNKVGLAGTSEDEVFITAEDTNLVSFNIDILHTYCFLLAFATFKHLAARAKAEESQGARDEATKAMSPHKPPQTKRKHLKPSISCRFDVKEVHTFVTLPRSTRIFMRIRRLEVRQDPRNGLSISTETVLGAVESPKHTKGNIWEEAVRLRDWRFLLPPKLPDEKREISVSGDAALIRIPYGYLVFPIIDNTSVAIKATKQLIYQFLNDKDDSVITPEAEDPKLLPDINLKLRVLTLEAEDDPFETKLNLVWRAGLAENFAREERDAAFAAKAEAIAASKGANSSTSFRFGPDDGSIRSSSSSILSDFEDDSDSATASHDDRSTRSPEEHVSYDQAKIALDAFNSSSWVRRYTNAQSEQTRRQEAVLKNIYGRFPVSRSLDDLPVKVLPIGRAAPLFRSTMYRVSLQVGQAHTPVDELRDFIHEKGAGVPKDIPYSLIVPLHIKWEMEEWRVTLRDYPMPLLHIPPTHRAEDDARKAWTFEGDLVLAEALGGPESIRHVPAVIVPAATGRPEAVEYGIIVPKVAMSVKVYGTPTVRLRTPYPTRVVWGQSIQPTIQDVMRVIDGITPPPHDPSPKLGFWDKLPLILHGHINLKFEDEGGFNIHMKGSRDPYSIEGLGAGWVKSWKGGVEIRVGYENPEKEFFQILSHEYILAVPDLCDYVDRAATGVLGGGDQQRPQSSRDGDGEGSYHDSYDRKSTDASFTSSMYRYMRDPTFRKIVIKLTNGVRWGAGLHGERTCDDETCPRSPKCHGEAFYRECRQFDRISHWNVIPKTHEHFESIPESERRDSFRGWRSHHLHFALSVFSPKNGIPGYGCSQDVAKVEALNNFYFSPLAWQHFWAWMRLFSSAMSLPIRVGKLFPDSPPPSPKFGRFLGTIKYRIDLAPLFIAHQYRQFNKDDWARGLRTHVGVKARVDSFTLDMHQRQQETVKDRPELGAPRVIFHKPFYEAEVKCDAIDLKTLAARMREDAGMAEAVEDPEIGESMFDDLFAGDARISDDELVWIDMNDFVELDSETIRDPSPKVRMFPALACPQFNYYRKVDSQRERRAHEKDDAARGKDRSHSGTDMEELIGRLERSKFGNEVTHTCMVGQNDKPYSIQRKLAQDRLHTIRREIDRILNSSDNGSFVSEATSERSDDHHDRLNDLHGRERILSGFITHLGRLQESQDRVERAHADGHPAPKWSTSIDRNFSANAADLASMYHDFGTFDNRYVAHNPTLFFSNVTRTLLLKYYYSSRLRRGYAHHMTATAVRYIRDLLKKKDKGDRNSTQFRQRHSSHADRTPQSETPNAEGGDGLDILHEMLEDTISNMMGKNGYSKTGMGSRPDETGTSNDDGEFRPTDGISDDFNVAKSNVCLLLKPQVVLRSDIDDNSTVIVTALRARLQNYTVQDESCAEDSVNAIVLRRNCFVLDSLQCYHPSSRAQSRVKKHGFVSLPLEALVDVHGHACDFERIVPHTNATLYYDKFNKLRLSDSSRSVATFRRDGKPVQDHLHHHMDMILLICPRFSVSANSEHFAAFYNVVTDLILYRDPAHRDHAKRLEEMMFSYDFTDVSGLADIVTALQLRIRDSRSLVEQYQLVSHRLNDRGKADFVALLGEMVDLVEELNLIMDAITTSQDSKGGADREKKSALRFMTQAQEVAWNMLGDEAGQLVAKLALRGISFSWLNKADNSAANTLSVQDLQALNVDPNALFTEIITKHTRAQNHPMAKEGRFLDAMWSVLPPVGGISIVDMFEFNLHPVKIQIELLVGRKIMDYIFGTKRQRDKQEEEQKRLEQEDNALGTIKAKKKSAFARLLGGRKSAAPNTDSTDTSRRPSPVASTQSLSNPELPSRSESASDLLSAGRPSSDDSKDDDNESITGRAQTKTGSSSGARNSAKTRPGTPSSAKDKDCSDHSRPGDQFAIAQRSAAEMRSRASAYRTFVYVKISETIFCLSYKGEKQKSITDLYDLVFRTPNFEYHNSTFGYVDLADNFKKDVFKAAWNQKSSLLRDIITHRPTRKRNAIESIRAIRQASRARDSLAPLDISVEPPTPTSKTSFDGSSHLVESPTDTFSFRDDRYGDQHNDEDADDVYDQDHDDHGDEESDDDDDRIRDLSAHDLDGDGRVEAEQHQGHSRSRNGTGQTLARQIRDAWGRDNATVDDEDASVGSDALRNSTSDVEDILSSQRTPQREAFADHDLARGFPTLGRSRNSDESPSTERGDATTLHSTTSASSSPFLHLPARRGSNSSPARSVSSFKLNRLIPKSFRQRASSGALGGVAGASGGRRRNSHSTGDHRQASSPLHDRRPWHDDGGDQVDDGEGGGGMLLSPARSLRRLSSGARRSFGRNSTASAETFEGSANSHG
ncbi:potential mitochondrial protein Fmp27 [Pseudozyma hubeiensis SY62]|uniref:Potential mitochondrial protein Fmp27 n=1 Tax=Pseudozyma hubeiensis (strain SY62) TaxID=1305764 RepID=R9NX69_PSEHS|nr:potential mitochondrial protein Fmp27 [Pseudozyma hubeiensis SY62]GAC93156.1 potential mitochondrial protein Fmp27 [Pseudozyma hubeiensis SY62]